MNKKAAFAVAASFVLLAAIALMVTRNRLAEFSAVSGYEIVNPGEMHSAMRPDGPWLVVGDPKSENTSLEIICQNGYRMPLTRDSRIIDSAENTRFSKEIPAFADGDYPAIWMSDGKAERVYCAKDGRVLWEKP